MIDPLLSNHYTMLTASQARHLRNEVYDPMCKVARILWTNKVISSLNIYVQLSKKHHESMTFARSNMLQLAQSSSQVKAACIEFVNPFLVFTVMLYVMQ